jgi:hypothetical protein
MAMGVPNPVLPRALLLGLLVRLPSATFVG